MEVGRVAGEETAEDFFEDLFEVQEEQTGPVINVGEKLQKATSLFNSNDFNEALEILNEVRNVEPGNEEMLLLMGRIYEKKELLGEAKDVLRGLVPGNLEASKLLTKIYQKNGEWEEALRLAQNINKRYPGEVFSYVASAQYLKRKKQYGKAIELLKTFRDWEKESEILLELSSLNLRLGKKKRASSLLEKSLSLSPSAEGYYQLSLRKIKERDYKGAVGSLLKARKRAPRDRRILKKLIRTYLINKSYDKVIKYVKEAKKIIKADSDLELWEGKALYSKGNFEEAITSLKQAMNFDDKNFEAYNLLASLYFRRGRYKEAENLWFNIVDKAEDEKILEKAKEAIESLLRLKKITGEM